MWWRQREWGARTTASEHPFQGGTRDTFVKLQLVGSEQTREECQELSPGEIAAQARPRALVECHERALFVAGNRGCFLALRRGWIERVKCVGVLG